MNPVFRARPRGSSVAAALLLAGLATGQAQPPPVTVNAPHQAVSTNGTPDRLSLAEAKRLAFERNWDLLAAKADVDMASAQKIMAHEFPNPTFAWSTAKVPVNGQPAPPGTGTSFWERSYDTILSVNQLLEIGGKRSSRQMSADRGFQAEQARFADARRLLDLGVTKAYIAAVQGASNARTLHDSASSLRHEAEIAAVRLTAGDISAADQSQIEILADRFELEARAAEASALQQRVALENLLGTPRPTGQWEATDALEDMMEAKVPDPEEAAMPRRPDLIAAEASLAKAEADLRLQKAMRVPDPTVMAMYEHNPPDANQTIGLGLSFPLPLWNHNRGAIQAAAAARDQAAALVEKVRGQIAADIVAARSAYREASARYENYLRVIAPKSAQVLKIISYAYEKGGTSLLDLLSAQRNDNEVRLAMVQAAADAAASQATLKAALTEMEAATSETGNNQ